MLLVVKLRPKLGPSVCSAPMVTDRFEEDLSTDYYVKHLYRTKEAELYECFDWLFTIFLTFSSALISTVYHLIT